MFTRCDSRVQGSSRRGVSAREADLKLLACTEVDAIASSERHRRGVSGAHQASTGGAVDLDGQAVGGPHARQGARAAWQDLEAVGASDHHVVAERRADANGALEVEFVFAQDLVVEPVSETKMSFGVLPLGCPRHALVRP